MVQQKIIQQWLQSAAKDREAAIIMYKAKQYHWSLFLWQLVLEKLLKTKLLNWEKKYFLPQFSYTRPACEPIINKFHKRELKEITSFNIEARYDDEN